MQVRQCNAIVTCIDVRKKQKQKKSMRAPQTTGISEWNLGGMKVAYIR